MTLVHQKPRSINIRTIQILEDGQDLSQFNWQTGGYLSFEVYDGFNAWTGRLQREEHRKDWPRDGVQEDLSGFDELTKLLRPVPKDEIYPEFPAEELTEYKPQQVLHADDSKAPPYLKAPSLCQHRDGSHDLAIRLLSEARIHEMILRNPHPSLSSYLGCVVEDGRLVRLALPRYSKSAHQRSQLETPDEFPLAQRMDCMDQIEAAATHLHSLGLAHNDISPSNIMFDEDGRAVLIDLDSCAPLGDALTKGGYVTGWKGPIAGEGLHFTQSSAECDRLAVQEIRKYFTEGLE